MSTFEQILDMDDEEDDKEFSRGIVFGFLEQAEQTFDQMDAALYELELIYHNTLLMPSLVHPETFLNCQLWDISSRDPRQRSASSR